MHAEGKFTFDRPLDADTYALVSGLCTTLRVARAGLDKGIYGVEGEFYVVPETAKETGLEASWIVPRRPPATQPSFHCPWYLIDSGVGISGRGVWGEGVSSHLDWLTYLLNTVLSPRKYVLTGSATVFFETTAKYKIIITRNQLRVKDAVVVFRSRKELLGSKKSRPSVSTRDRAERSRKQEAIELGDDQ